MSVSFFSFHKRAMPEGNTKGSANMWWIIIGAVIALVVLIVLLVFFTKSTNTLGIGLLECQSKGGTCDYTGAQCKLDHAGTVSTAFKCEGIDPNENVDTKKVCCFTDKN
jgi:hypothetical protein